MRRLTAVGKARVGRGVEAVVRAERVEELVGRVAAPAHVAAGVRDRRLPRRVALVLDPLERERADQVVVAALAQRRARWPRELVGVGRATRLALKRELSGAGPWREANSGCPGGSHAKSWFRPMLYPKRSGIRPERSATQNVPPGPRTFRAVERSGPAGRNVPPQRERSASRAERSESGTFGNRPRTFRRAELSWNVPRLERSARDSERSRCGGTFRPNLRTFQIPWFADAIP